ncbi:hypothetical protein E8E14_002895 [Neopestalotiopsis sp. 37M]|nr:hypothetical protein E8E14_002895 [Neopestalotiopsis sp. 37M]
MSSTIQRPSAAYLRRSGNVDSLPASTSWHAFSYPTSTFVHRIMTGLWLNIRTGWCRFLNITLHDFLLWSICTCLLVISCIIEQEPSPVGLRLAMFLACIWLVPINLHVRKLVREFRERGRDDSFIVTTAMLAFVFIKAFAIIDGYSMVALMRVPPCLTFAVWIASHWCNSDVPPQIHFGA